VINDFTSVTGHAITIPDTSTLAKTDEIAAHRIVTLKIAIIVTNKELFDLADAYQSMMEHMNFDCKIFKTLEQARQWVTT